VYGRRGIVPRGDEIGIHAVQGGDVVRDHTVMFFGDGERIEVRHQAHSRQAFAGGAVRAAGWVMEQSAGVYSMADVLEMGKYVVKMAYTRPCTLNGFSGDCWMAIM
jgi:4-hydroxy-tetrahydrodipicolinate reductase